jgi:hypothetical protein
LWLLSILAPLRQYASPFAFGFCEIDTIARPTDHASLWKGIGLASAVAARLRQTMDSIRNNF